ncbi:hypothetical protein LPJ58_000350 [Coemansia sp. RSA 1591]|nr:hypothetical protein LPJ58_000350 [Coemansia sp. RSA 1591]
MSGYAAATRTAVAVVAQMTGTPMPTLMRRDDDDEDEKSTSEINIDVSFLFDWGNAPGTGPYFSTNNIDAAQQITTAALMGSICLLVFSLLRLRWPELYSHRLRLRHMRPSNIPRTLFAWIYPTCTMSDRHVLETIGLDAVLYFRAFRMFIYMFICLSAFGMLVLYPVNFYWGREENSPDEKHTIFDSPLASVTDLSGRYSVSHVILAYVFALILFFYIDRFALHTITMRWHYLLLTRRTGNSRTLMITHLPRELRSEQALFRFVRGMRIGEIEAVHVAPLEQELTQALAHRAKVLGKLETAFVAVLGNPCRARSYDPELLKRAVLTDTDEARLLERRLLRRWARRKDKKRNRPVERPQLSVMQPVRNSETGKWQWPLRRIDAIDHWRTALFAADVRLQKAREHFHGGEGGTSAFVTMTHTADAFTISQLSVHARPDTCKIRMAPEARAVVWKNVGRPYSAKMLRYVVGLVMTVALLLLWSVPVVLLSTLISLRFLVTRSPGLADVVKNNQFVRSLLSYTLPSLILTIFTTILPRVLWGFVLVGGDRAYSIADKNMFIRHLYFLIIYIVIVIAMTGSVWSSVYDMFTDFGGFWKQLVNVLPQMATWYCVYVMLYGAGYQVLKLLHLKSVCRYLFLQAKAATPRDYMKAISPVFIDWGTFQPYTVLFFFIGILYSHLQPLLLPMCLLYFLVGIFVMRYMCIYSWYFRQQNAGTIWPVIFRRMVVCIMAYQALTTAIFSGDDNHWFVAPMIVLMIFTWFYFWVRCSALKSLSESLPLQLLREAERRRKVTLMRERKEALISAAASPKILPGNMTGRPTVLLTKPTSEPVYPNSAEPNLDPSSIEPNSVAVYAQPTGQHSESSACDLDEQALMPNRQQPPRTLSWLHARLHAYVVHPIRSIIGSVSYALVWLKGDPSAQLWDHIDDYAFPERVERLKPAGRTAHDPHMAKEQPGSLLDILKSVFVGIPRACASVGKEFFMKFHIPRAHLDTSQVSYPRAENIESAFETTHRRLFPKSKKKLAAASTHAAGTSSLPSSANESDVEDEVSSIFPPPSTSTGHPDSLRQMQYCLAPAQELPPSFVPRISEKDDLLPLSVPRSREQDKLAPLAIPPRNQQPVKKNAVPMQFQEFSSELPFGTQMNRRRTDFSQSNMSYVPGVLDSTQFMYEHPGLYGDLPSLWLPVQCLKHRTELKRTATQRLKSAVHALESAFEDNFLGERTAEKLHAKRRDMKRRVRDATRLTPFSTRGSQRSSLDSGSNRRRSTTAPVADDSISVISDVLPAGGRPPAAEISGVQVQQKMQDMMVRSKCSALGIDPAVFEQWDPLCLHRSSTKVVVNLDDNSDMTGLPADIDPILETESLAHVSDNRPSSPALSASDSDFDDSDDEHLLPELSQPANPLRQAEEGKRQ